MWLWHVHSWNKWAKVSVKMQTTDSTGNVVGSHSITQQQRTCQTCGLVQTRSI